MLTRITPRDCAEFIQRQWGTEVLQAVLAATGLEHTEQVFPDDQLPPVVKMLEALVAVGAAADLTTAAQGMWAHCLGKHQALDELLRVAGRSLPDMIVTLSDILAPSKDLAHMHSALDMRCANVSPEALELHCHGPVDDDVSATLIDGLIRLASRRYHGIQDLQVQREEHKHPTNTDTAGAACRTAKHTVFHLRVPPAPAGRQGVFSGHLQALEASVAEARSSGGYAWTDATAFREAFPFHLVLDSECRVLQAGSALCRMCPGLSAAGAKAADHFQITHPADQPWDLPQLLQYGVGASGRSTLVITTRQGGLGLKGTLMRTTVTPQQQPQQQPARGAAGTALQVALFIGAPLLTGAADLKCCGLYLADLAPHDLSSDRVVAGERQAYVVRELGTDVEALEQALEQAQQRPAALSSVAPSSILALQLIERMLNGGISHVSSVELVAAREALLSAAGHEPGHASLFLCGGHIATVPDHAPALPYQWQGLAGEDAEVNQSLLQLLVPQARSPLRVDFEAFGGVQALVAPATPLQQIAEVSETLALPTINSSGAQFAARLGSGPKRACNDDGLGHQAVAASEQLPAQQQDDALLLDSSGYLEGPGSGKTCGATWRPGASSSRSGLPPWRQEQHAQAHHTPAPVPQPQGEGPSLGPLGRAKQQQHMGALVELPEGAQGGAATARRASLDSPASLRDKAKCTSSLYKFRSFFNSMMGSSGAKQAAQSSAGTPQSPHHWQAAAPGPPRSPRGRSRSCDEPSANHMEQHAQPHLQHGVAHLASGGTSTSGLSHHLRQLSLTQGHVSLEQLLMSANSSRAEAEGSSRGGAHSSSGGMRPSASLAALEQALMHSTGTFNNTAAAGAAAGLGILDSAGAKDVARERHQAVLMEGVARAAAASPSSTPRSMLQAAATNRQSVVASRQERTQRETEAAKVAQETAARALPKLYSAPSEELLCVLSSVDAWLFDSFALERAANGRPLSVLGFALLQRAGITRRLHIDEQKLARFLVCIEDGYTNNPYHNRIHAADVLRTLHVIATRGGLLKHVTADKPLNSGDMFTQSFYVQHLPPASPCNADGPPGRASNCGAASGAVGPLDTSYAAHEAFMLLTVYLAAIIHDYDHRGVNNAFLVRSGDPLALLYNDASPMENHHTAAAFALLRQPDNNFLGNVSRELLASLRSQVIELVLSTDMKQHFGTVSMFEHKAQAAQQQQQQAEALEVVPATSSFRAIRGISGSTSTFPTSSGGVVAGGPHASHSSYAAAGNVVAADGAAGTSKQAISVPPQKTPMLMQQQQQSLGTAMLGGGPGNGDAGRQRGVLALAPAVAGQPSFGRNDFLMPLPSNMGGSRDAQLVMQLDNDGGQALGHSGHPRSTDDFMLLAPAGEELDAQVQDRESRASRSGERRSRFLGQVSGVLPSSSLSRRGLSSNSMGSRQPITNLLSLDDDTRLLIWKVALKCADLGHLASPWEVHRRWVTLLEEEMFKQGDRERAAAIPVSPLMDRTKQGITKSQPGFFNVVALPMYTAFVTAFPSAVPLLAGVRDNHALWQQQQQTQQPRGEH